MNDLSLLSILISTLLKVQRIRYPSLPQWIKLFLCWKLTGNHQGWRQFFFWVGDFQVINQFSHMQNAVVLNSLLNFVCAGEVFCTWTLKQISKLSIFIATFVSLAAVHSELDAKHDYCKLLTILTVNHPNLPSSAGKVVWGSEWCWYVYLWHMLLFRNYLYLQVFKKKDIIW